MPDGSWIAVDDAHVAGGTPLMPWPGRNLLWERHGFGYYPSSSRMFVEQVLGQLVGPRGILRTPIRMSLRAATRTVRVCAKLRNFLIDRCSPVP